MNSSCLILTIFLALFARSNGQVLCTRQFKNLLACAELSEGERQAIECDSCILKTSAIKGLGATNCDDYEQEYCNVYSSCSSCAVSNCEDAVAAYRDCAADANPDFPDCEIGCRSDFGFSKASGEISSKAIAIGAVATGFFLAYL